MPRCLRKGANLSVGLPAVQCWMTILIAEQSAHVALRVANRALVLETGLPGIPGVRECADRRVRHKESMLRSGFLKHEAKEERP